MKIPLNRLKLLKIILLLFCFSSCLAQSEIENKIEGKWILVAETDSLDDSINPFGDSNSEPKLNTTITFDLNDKIYINQNGNEYNANYKVRDSILIIGNRQYIITELNENKMIYKDKNGLLDKHYEYKKAK